MVTERLLHAEETKLSGRLYQTGLEGVPVTGAKKKLRCHFCHRLKRDCPDFANVKEQNKLTSIRMKTKIKVFKVTITANDGNSTDSESTGPSVQP